MAAVCRLMPGHWVLFWAHFPFLAAQHPVEQVPPERVPHRLCGLDRQGLGAEHQKAPDELRPGQQCGRRGGPRCTPEAVVFGKKGHHTALVGFHFFCFSRWSRGTGGAVWALSCRRSCCRKAGSSAGEKSARMKSFNAFSGIFGISAKNLMAIFKTFYGLLKELMPPLLC